MSLLRYALYALLGYSLFMKGLCLTCKTCSNFFQSETCVQKECKGTKCFKVEYFLDAEVAGFSFNRSLWALGCNDPADPICEQSSSQYCTLFRESLISREVNITKMAKCQMECADQDAFQPGSAAPPSAQTMEEAIFTLMLKLLLWITSHPNSTFPTDDPYVSLTTVNPTLTTVSTDLLSTSATGDSSSLLSTWSFSPTLVAVDLNSASTAIVLSSTLESWRSSPLATETQSSFTSLIFATPSSPFESRTSSSALGTEIQSSTMRNTFSSLILATRSSIFGSGNASLALATEIQSATMTNVFTPSRLAALSSTFGSGTASSSLTTVSQSPGFTSAPSSSILSSGRFTPSSTLAVTIPSPAPPTSAPSSALLTVASSSAMVSVLLVALIAVLI